MKNGIPLWLVILAILWFLGFLQICTRSAQRVVDKMVATVNAGVRTDLITIPISCGI